MCAMATSFRLLGPVAMFSGTDEMALGHPKQRSVLAALLVSVNQPVSTSSLIDQVWGESPPPSVRSALYTYIAKLRTVLAVADARLLRRSSRYVLEADPASVDIHRFRSLVSAASWESTPPGGPNSRLGPLSEAVALWGGEPFEGFRTPWFDAQRAGLQAEYRNVRIRRNRLLLAFARYDELMPELLRMTGESPLDEELAAQMITTLDQSGRRAEALDEYHRVRSALSEEMGIDPGPGLQDLYHGLLRAGRPGAEHRRAGAAEPRRLPLTALPDPAAPVSTEAPHGQRRPSAR